MNFFPEKFSGKFGKLANLEEIRMQPSATASMPQGGEMESIQSMDWLFKKERIYLLAQFWQQRATLAEKEVTTLKEQLGNNSTGCETKEGISMDRQTFENEIVTKDKEINQLLDEIQQLQTCVQRLQEQVDQKSQQINRLENRLDAQKDYDEIKRELSILLKTDLPTENSKTVELLLEKSKSLQEDKSSSHDDGVATHQDASPNHTSPSLSLPQPFQNLDTLTTPPLTLPPPFQNVETFGTMLDRPKSITPIADSTQEKSAASTPIPQEHQEVQSPNENMVNGNPKSPEDNNNHHLSNNNIPITPINFLRTDDLKSPYRPFDEHRTFRFAEELGMAPGSMVSRLGESLIPKGDPMEAKLQEMLRYNMDKYASQSLDTLHIARKVRELLSIHNIGQRLFAKYILGLSQGTVSELLSKPKPWDKLTEKGRDSYRKMHAWACDENAIMLLKSLIPKKGKEPGMPPFGRPESDLTEERLAHILSEANQFQQMKQEDSRGSNEDSKSPHGCSSPFFKESSLNKRLKKYENDDIPQEKVVRIYQEELAKLMSRRIDDMRNPREFPSGASVNHSAEEIKMVLDTYHREFSKLNQPGNPGQMPLGLLALQQQALAQHHQAQQQNGGVQDLSIPKDKMKLMNGMIDEKDIKEEEMRHSGSAFSLVRPKLEPGSQQSTGSTASSPLGNTILPPMTPTDEFSAGSAAASPLQRMASITNSLISQPPSTPHHSSSQRPLKAVLPPITQQQFDLYNNLNTEDIVKKVKEQLSQYSISQRLFGENVLGLSQGSVSDLLARPKPWHMLTQKGREPFIRMKMFLEDDNAVHKLVASQYKIAPEKLMRTGGYGGACSTPIMNKPMPPTPKMLSEAAGLLNKMQETQNLLPSSMQLGPPPSNNIPQPPPPPMLLTPPGIPPHHAINLQNPDHMKKTSQSPLGVPHNHMASQHASLRNMHQHMSPSVYEMAALTQDLDTQIITTKIKEALLANNIGQKIFGEAVLGLSQGSVSELLSKPKPWHMLSIKGREPFIRMQLWLNDAHNVDRLQALKNERREANKRRRSSGPGAHDNSSDTSSNDTSEFYHSNSPGPVPGGPPSAKKQRVLFSEEQKEALKLAFALDPYPNVATIEFLASELGLSSRTITNWFHNHRMRLKQQVPHGLPSEIPPRDQSGNSQPFDPVQFRLLLNQRLMELNKERMGLGGVHLPYPPYLAANSNLAALISRGLLPTGEVDLAALNAVKHHMSQGLDLSMGRLKNEHDFEDEEDDHDDQISNGDSDESGSLHSQQVKMEQQYDTPRNSSQSRSSRRKPSAPQWVNPEWQETPTKEGKPTGNEVIINGVCVMQTNDFDRRNAEETVHVEPTAVHDRFDDDRSNSSTPQSTDQNNDEDKDEDRDQAEEQQEEESEVKDDSDISKNVVKEENESERWDY